MDIPEGGARSLQRCSLFTVGGFWFLENKNKSHFLNGIPNFPVQGPFLRWLAIFGVLYGNDVIHLGMEKKEEDREATVDQD